MQIERNTTHLRDISNQSGQYIYNSHLVVENFMEPVGPFNPSTNFSGKVIFQSTTKK